jgi:hypothetical protein
MTKRFEFKILDNEDTILRDGETLTNRMMMRDSVTRDAVQIALDATEALKVRDAAIFAASRRPGFVFSDTLDSQATARAAARQTSYDSYDRDISTAWQRKAPVTETVDTRQAWHDAHNAERAASGTDTRRATMDAAYAAVDEELQNAWRKPAEF